MNTLFAPIYDQNWGASIAPSHAEFIGKFLAQCPPGCTVLDAACGTGKYWPLILASGRRVSGIDQSQEMLNRAQAKFPDVPVRKLGLQEFSDAGACDALICVDAMENIFPEDWPVVLGNFYRALRPGGLLYFTVELADPDETQAAFEKGQAVRS
jgi:ubiquinone/menaquinone biosynthesis C-methylase UbiE